MHDIIIKNALVVNEGVQEVKDLAIKNKRIEKIQGEISTEAKIEIDAAGQMLLPGIIDDQVHFREPGLTHKATIGTESKAGIAGGVTSFMEMPNTKPPATTQEKLAEKYATAADNAWANYSFYMGASNDNLDEVLRTDPKNVCGIKIFMGSSTGNMLVDNTQTLEGIFSQTPMLIATHCEDEATIRKNQEEYLAQAIRLGKPLSAKDHPLIRSREGCYISSSMAVDLAKKHGTKLHILHISTAEETSLFTNKPLSEKHITSEACVHHLFFDESDYESLGNDIKCNPAIKSYSDRKAIQDAVKEGFIDVIATDHAPHTREEKNREYNKAPSGLPLLQTSLQMMHLLISQGVFDWNLVVDKMCHKVAELFRIKERGYIREGYMADLVLYNAEQKGVFRQKDMHYKCGWTPLNGMEHLGEVTHTFLNGHLVYQHGSFNPIKHAERLLFDW